LARFSTILPVFLASEALVLLLGTFQPTVASWILTASQVFPFPFQGNAPATGGLLGAILGFALSFLFEPGQVQRSYARIRTKVAPAAPRISYRHSLIAPQGWKPLPPPVKYFGGKSRLAPKIVARIPEHKTWVEPFAGGASVTLAKPPSQREVLADKRSDLVRFYRHLKAGKKIVVPAKTKAVFDRIKHKPEAARSPGEFVRLQGSSFGGHGQSFAAGTQTSGTLLNKRLDSYSERLKRTSIINKDYASTIKQYDSPSALPGSTVPHRQSRLHGLRQKDPDS
jgi:hypothetical protein